jgi:hypothetical protein
VKAVFSTRFKADLLSAVWFLALIHERRHPNHLKSHAQGGS